jgi:serine protease Do
VSVVFADRQSFRAEIVGTDPQSDLALLRVDGRNLPVVAWGDSAALRAGDWAIAVGAPLERVQTVTAGIVSAIGRHSLGISDYEDFIQTDAAINPGNSGGPLVDAQGRVIGVNTAFVAQSGGGSGIGFAVPANMARVIAERLRADGRVVRGWLGAALKDGDLGDGPATGALVHEVDGSSPARRAGLRQGDVLVALDGAPVTGAAEVRNRIALARPGSSLQVRFLRDGAPQTATVKIGTKP